MAVTDAVTFNALDTPTGVPRRDANALAGRCPSRTIVLSRTSKCSTCGLELLTELESSMCMLCEESLHNDQAHL
jgi:hypothetical protein